MVRKFLIIGSFAAIYLLWGSTYFAIALGLKSFPPFLLMGVRSLFGGLILVALCGREIIQHSRRTWLNAGLSGLLFFVGCHGVLAFAQQTVPSGVAAIVLATIPLWIVLLDFLLPQEKRPAPLTMVALVPGFCGVAVVARQNIGENAFSILPILWLLGAALSWSAGTVWSRRTASDGSSTLISGMQLVIGGAVLLAISSVTGEVKQFSPQAVSATSLGAVTYLVVAGSVIGFAAYHWLLGNIATPLVSTYTFVNPVVAMLLGTIFLRETFSAAMIFGAGLVLASIIVMWRSEHATAFGPRKELARAG
jgi:drug/metabolite transporter (DMT)-like permease